MQVHDVGSIGCIAEIADKGRAPLNASTQALYNDITLYRRSQPQLL